MNQWLPDWLRGKNRTEHDRPQPIVIVSGLPRSGTSLMMKMLAAGGLPLVTDGQRQADADNPQGYYEFERVKQLERGDVRWLPNARGKAVKVISSLLRHLPPEYSYQVIFMERDLGEILASQRQMLVRRQTAAEDALEDGEVAVLFAKHLQEIRQWLEYQPHISTLYVHYNHLLADALPQVERIHHFLGATLQLEPMLRVIDPTLYRNRQR